MPVGAWKEYFDISKAPVPMSSHLSTYVPSRWHIAISQYSVGAPLELRPITFARTNMWNTKVIASREDTDKSTTRDTDRSIANKSPLASNKPSRQLPVQ
ncbi:hypothetical protein EG328_006940 [Venturia inaequalis]|uniref:Uncharacterized protein n=1 Tax=Venturia inaequalis TaxID=5025 RepID=A0A8H3UG37_VENIN|nr:hypothetical protein EG328_006940 [Venturia inaequalis]